MEERREDASSIDSASGSNPDQISNSACIPRESKSRTAKPMAIEISAKLLARAGDVIE
jgi:hypothetical protein